MIDVAAVTATRNAFELARGVKPNVYRNRVTMQAAAMVAAHRGCSLDTNANYNQSVVYRSWITVRCYICGNEVSNGGWQFEHINDDGNGLAGDELAKAIVDGRQDVDGIHFGCGTCNAAKNAERAFYKRVEKSTL